MSNPPNEGLTLKSTPTIFVLPTHLSLEELHETEDRLLQHHANLTYDITEARFILGKVAHKKRAALELRSRGVWTEEVTAPISSASSEPLAKRRRVDHAQSPLIGGDIELMDLSTETEGEEDGTHNAKRHVTKPDTRDITVIKLAWLDDCVKADELLPIDAYTIYPARKIPSKTSPAQAKAGRPAKTTTTIIERAQADRTTASQPPPPPAGAVSRPPKLTRQTTSEQEQEIDQAQEPKNPLPDWILQNNKYACQRSTPLHPVNTPFLTQLLKIRTIRTLTLDEIGIRAYSTAIAAIAAYPYHLKSPSEVLRLPGCDAKIAALFSEFQHSDSGTLSAAEVLDTDPALRTLNMFSHIWGIGPKTAREFYYVRGFREVDDIVEFAWGSLSRVQQIGVKYREEFDLGIGRGEVEEIAGVIMRHANAVRPSSLYSHSTSAPGDGNGDGVQCIIVGGYRRGKESCGDVDVILTHRNEDATIDLIVDVVASLEKEGWITHTLTMNMAMSAREQRTLPLSSVSSDRHFDSLDKALVVWQDPEPLPPQPGTPGESHTQQPPENGDGGNRERKRKNPNPHRRVDIIVSPWRTIGCAVLGWTGDTTFERDLRRYAKKERGWKFDSSGIREVRDGGKVVDLEDGGRTWEEREILVMEGLGVGWREPGERCTL